jgi:hypothetical protein
MNSTTGWDSTIPRMRSMTSIVGSGASRQRLVDLRFYPSRGPGRDAGFAMR